MLAPCQGQTGDFFEQSFGKTRGETATVIVGADHPAAEAAFLR